MSKAWEEKKIPLLQKFNIIGDHEPDLKAPSVQILKDAQNFVTLLRNDAARSNAKKSFNPPAQNTSKAIKHYREKLVAYLSSSDTERKALLKDLNASYDDVMSKSKPSEGQAFLVANLHYDIAPDCMSTQHTQMVQRHRAFHTKHTLERAINVMKKLETEPAHFEKIVGRSVKKLNIFKELAIKIKQLASTGIYDEVAARNAITPWKRNA